jgi:hypothetical protein
MKAVSTAIIFLLIAVILGAIFLWPYLSQFKFPVPTYPKYKNDLITVEEYYVSSLNPYPDTQVFIDFLIQNNGDKPIEEARVNFFDLKLGEKGFSNPSLFCAGESKECRKEKCECEFKHIDPLDIRKISLNIKTPPSETVKFPYPLEIFWFIEYKVTGYRILNIPIVDGVTRTIPTSKFSQSKPSYGPIVLEFEPSNCREREEYGKKIRECWGIANRPLEVVMEFKPIGSRYVGKIVEPINITNMSLKLPSNLDIKVPEELPCDFEQKGDKWYLNKIINVPSEVKCNFIVDQIDIPELIANIEAEFNYTYKFIRSQNFVIQPLQ